MNEYDELDVESKGNHKQFIDTILKFSKNKENYQIAIKEWEWYGDSFDLPSHCICGQYIKQNLPIHNKLNGWELIIGNRCIRKIGKGIERKPASKSKINYLEAAKKKAKNVGELSFIQRLIDTLEMTDKIICLSKKESDALIRIAGIPCRFKIYIDIMKI